MTLTEVKNELFSFFLKNEIFSATNFKDIMVITDVLDTEFKKALIVKALEELEKADLVVKIATNKSESWILKTPLQEYKQNIEINGNLAEYISEVLNKVYNKLEEDVSPPNKLNITADDIASLAGLLDSLVKEND